MIGMRLDALASAFGTSKGPLQGLQVLDAGTMIAGLPAATHLADFGAEVVKIGQPRIGDALWHWAPMRYYGANAKQSL